MGNEEILLPNGTCYRSRDAEADGEFMPCGNDGYFNSHFACCSSGARCLSSNACYNFKRPDLKLPKDEPTPCDFLDNNQISFMDSLSTIAVLPTAPGETIAYLLGQTPTMQSAFSPSATAISTPTSSATPDTKLSLSAKAGFGAGALVRALLIGGLIYQALLLRKRKKKGGRQHDHAMQPPAPPQTIEWSAPAYAPLSTSPSLTGFKSELAADGLPRVLSNMILSSDSSWTQPQRDSQQRYQAYDPRIHRDYSNQRQSSASELFSAPSGYGQYGPAPVSPQQAGHPPPFPPIAELQG
ncbi:hypothetical protein DL764_006364 [Monosporascus ibericus]|uniref:Uncharacterized protein n=1 Tax=Monosporascus ibericus TaxID=155417 RepID=A0A4Q4T5A1_9PEZI|nr:hypothetical protein DL764_006364 [Monosporascus ibericus]